jgi:MarR family transcriptional regulator, transcriptional regulator for hemolysin
MRPTAIPPGLHLTQVSRTVSRAFDEELAAAGGSLPVWLVLLNLKARNVGNQRELATAVGITEATLTHHLNAMEAADLIIRRRDPANRRVHVVELTKSGEEAFLRLRTAAIAFDARLRGSLTERQLADFGAVLGQLAANVGGTQDGLPWAGLAGDRP